MVGDFARVTFCSLGDFVSKLACERNENNEKKNKIFVLFFFSFFSQANILFLFNSKHHLRRFEISSAFDFAESCLLEPVFINLFVAFNVGRVPANVF